METAYIKFLLSSSKSIVRPGSHTNFGPRRAATSAAVDPNSASRPTIGAKVLVVAHNRYNKICRKFDAFVLSRIGHCCCGLQLENEKVANFAKCPDRGFVYLFVRSLVCAFVSSSFGQLAASRQYKKCRLHEPTSVDIEPIHVCRKLRIGQISPEWGFSKLRICEVSCAERVSVEVNDNTRST